LLGSFLRDHAGSNLIIFAMALPVILGCIGIAVDHGLVVRAKQVLQEAADAGALAGARELSLVDTRRENVSAVVQAVVDAYLQAHVATNLSTSSTVAAQVLDDPLRVEVSAASAMNLLFPREIHGLTVDSINAASTARVIGKPNICVLGLNPTAPGTISLEHNAWVTGQNCSVFSNSDHTLSIKSKNSARLEASFICTRGGKDGGPGHFTPDPMTDCPAFDDPLADRPEPMVGACNPAMPTTITSNTTLDPGTYCGLTIDKGARVTLTSGIYVFRDKPLIVTGGGSLIGNEVGLFFTGTAGYFTFDTLSTIELSAPTSGPMAGLLLFSSRTNASTKAPYSILSDDARTLVGTVYIPKGELRIDANKPIADKSAYTAIVADTMRLYGGPHLVLNTNYALTDVPVPEGIKGAGQPVALSK
jgi:Flp pilus assembly protein TadG